jgi:peptidoglycan/LPS O-acetylase OafA/YrhL
MGVEQPPRAGAKRFEGLDALRGVCALMVVLYHFPAPGLTSSSLLIRHSDGCDLRYAL